MDQVSGTNFYIYQDKDDFSFGIDAVLLSDFTKAKKNHIDLCTGNGIVALRLAYIYDDTNIVGADIDHKAIELFKKSIEINKLDERVKAMEVDIREIEKYFKKNTFDSLSVNPPYLNPKDNIASGDYKRQELLLNLDDIARAASYLLKPYSKIFMVHRPARLVDIILSFKKYGINLRKLRAIKPFAEKKANMILLELEKSEKEGFDYMKELIVYNNDGSYTDEVKEIYYGNE